MKKLLSFINKIYRNIRIEKQFLIIEDESGAHHYLWISDDVSEAATNSSYEKFKEAARIYKEVGGEKCYIIHNHPKASPEPSLMDFKNAQLLNSWSSVLGIPVNDYMIYSTFGYYSFFEAGDWCVPMLRHTQEASTIQYNLNEFTYTNLLMRRKEINTIMECNEEMSLIGSRLYFSSCLPLEKLKKIAENEGVKNIFFFKRKPDGEKTIRLVKSFLQPTTIIEILPDGQWVTVL